MLTSWMFLAGAVVGDAAGTYALERSGGLRRRGPVAVAAVAYLLAIVAFAQALQGIAVSVADAVYAAAGTALVTVVGVTVLGERLGARKATGLVLVLLGVVALRVQGA
jgi:multidrug transporter EmrE-like cation transporter